MSAGPRPEDAVQLAQNALQTVNELQDTVDAQADYIENLEQRVQELESAQPDATDYNGLDRDDKVGLVRAHLVHKANELNGKAQLAYHGIQWEVFDGEPSVGHCYTLMKRAAQERGFTEGTDADDNKTVKVQTAKISTEKEQALLSRVNKTQED